MYTNLTIVTKKQALLLRELEFKWHTIKFYLLAPDDFKVYTTGNLDNTGKNYLACNGCDRNDTAATAPSIQRALMWLRSHVGYHIEITCNETFDQWKFNVRSKNNTTPINISNKSDIYRMPEQAYSAGLTWTLEYIKYLQDHNLKTEIYQPQNANEY